MTGVVRPVAWSRIATPRMALGVVLLVATVAGLLIVDLARPSAALSRGWLVAFAIWSCVPIGSMILLLIHGLTGGAWGTAAAPVLRPAAAATVLVGIAFVPVLASLSQIYPWANASSTIPQDVARWYLNQPWFVLRAAVTLAGWSLLGLVFAQGSTSRLLAALGLAFYGVTISLVAVDWYLSLEPHYVATAFAATIAMQQLAVALAAVAVFAAPELNQKVRSDIGALLIATVLGVVYLEFMTFVVAWYGDLPDKAAWYLKRSSAGWSTEILLAFMLGAVLPFSMLLVKAVRRSRGGLQLAGTLILVGSGMHILWLLVPALDQQAIVLSVAGGGLFILAAGSLLIGNALSPILETRRA